MYLSLFISFICLSKVINGLTFKSINSFNLEHCAVVNVAEHFPRSNVLEDPPAILVSTFYPFGSDEVVVVTNASLLLESSTKVKPFTIENITAWPNLVSWVKNDETVLKDNSKGTVLVAGGFFVSSAKSTGTVDLFDVTNFPNIKHRK